MSKVNRLYILFFFGLDERITEIKRINVVIYLCENLHIEKHLKHN